MTKRFVYTLMAVAVILAGCKGGNNAGNGSEAVAEEQEETVMEEKVLDPVVANAWEQIGEEPLLKITTDDGVMVVKLYKETPLHRDNFVKLAKSGFYDDIMFHRIIKGFMIQTGDPYSKDSTQLSKVGTGGPGYTIPAEILPQFSHKKGALAAARRGDSVNPAKESSGSQFYIVQDEDGCRHLDGEYTIFGEVVEGIDVIDTISGEDNNTVAIISIEPAQK